jgi:glycosyltransferase involved in cell wall biosynthesis
MRIGIDARMFGPRVGGGGLGRYVEQLVGQLQTMDQANRFVLFLKPEGARAFRASGPNFETRIADVHWYTLSEQLFLAKQLDAEGLDLIHFPHWNVPMNIRTPFVVTIHDLILLEEPRSSHATTLNPLWHAIKYAAFKRVLRHALTASRKIITVSAYTKSAIKKFFPEIPEEKMVVIYEGVTDLKTPATGYQPPAAPYFLYVGNAYPHKNLESLLHAFSFFCRVDPAIQLVLAGRQDAFYDRLRQELEEIGVPKNRVRFVMNPSDEELADLYRGATLYLFPSRTEGFGLPALEAMSMGVPVAASTGGSLPEVLGDAAVYFPPDDIEEMVAVMQKAAGDAALRKQLSQRGSQRIKQFSWKTMAEQTLNVYEEVRHR